jgi:hypothetical protein
MMTRLLGTAAALALALPAVAQDSAGSITGRYNADDAVWTVGSPDGADLPASGWRETENGIEVTLVGLPGPAEVGRNGGPYDNALVVSFTLEGQPQELAVREPSVMLRTGEGPELLARPINIDLSVTAVEITGEDMALAGDLVATLTPGGQGDLTIESEDAVLIDGNFQATLVRTGSES